MTELTTDLVTIAQADRVLARQADHCRAGADYLSTRGSITGSTGLILMSLGPLSDVVVAMGAAGLRLAGQVCEATSGSARASVEAYQRVDSTAADRLVALAGGLGAGFGGTSAPRTGSPYETPLGPALSSAPADHGQTDSWFWEKAEATGESIADIVANVRGMQESVTAWGGGSGGVAEAVDASSFLVEPTADENWIADLRWNAGLLLGSVDWVFTQLMGWSFLEECIFKPFGGDSRGVTKAAGAWTHTGELLGAVGVNHARLVPTTVEGWRGEAGDAFRVAMGLLSEGFTRLVGVCDAVSSALKAVALVIKGVCAGIGFALRKLSQLLIEIAAELAVPGVGWGVLLATAYWKVETIVSLVRLVYTLIESVYSAISAFAEAQASAVEGWGRFEDLAEGVFRRAMQAAGA